MKDPEVNPAFEQALNFINHTGRHIFLTGKAGTGKTTLLRHLRDTTFKQMCVVAPTGVAAVNAGGSTIHSFLQLPFGPFIPAHDADGRVNLHQSRLPEMKFSASRLSAIRALELLVIDEASMVRADLLDLVDLVLRRARRNYNEPFGGVQLLLIGDLYQLPPVAKSDEWELLKQHYATPYFFDSYVMREHAPLVIELEKVYRQRDNEFITILNKVRDNRMDAESLSALNARFKSSIQGSDQDEAVTLTTHNVKADAINTESLAALTGPARTYTCEIDGTFPPGSFPAEESLTLKKGARVMFVRNNTEKNYFNGKTGVVVKLDKEYVTVRCEGDEEPITVFPETWNNVTYVSDKSGTALQEHVTGTFSQIPLRLAWAITIHKSQGLTFDKVIIDAADSFTPGQVYVALSRCRSLEGIILSSRISERAMRSDQSVASFSNSRTEPAALPGEYRSSRDAYMRSIISGIFDFHRAVNLKDDLSAAMREWKMHLNAEAFAWQEKLNGSATQIMNVASRFRAELDGLYSQCNSIETDPAIRTRLMKAGSYFFEELGNLADLISRCPVRSESKPAVDALTPLVVSLHGQVAEKRALIGPLRNKGFDFLDHVKQRLTMSIPPVAINLRLTAKSAKIDTSMEHPGLYRALLEVRDEICTERNKPAYMVASAKSLQALAEYLPTDESELEMMPGFGAAKVKTFGDIFLGKIREYIAENDLVSNMDKFVPLRGKGKKKQGTKAAAEKVPSREISLKLFNAGMDVSQIAAQRGITPSTVESHLSYYVQSGEIDVDRLIDISKKRMILEAIEGSEGLHSMSAIKSRLPDDVTWSDIRYVQAHIAGAE